MPFTISEGLSSNKPPPPQPEPETELFPITKTLTKGRQVWLSAPQPDHITMIVPITPTVYAHSVASSQPVEGFANGLGKYFQTEPFNAHWAGGNVWWNEQLKKPRWKVATLTMGGRQALVHFELLYTKAGGHRLRIDLNPRKLGKKGFAQLRLVLGGPNAPFNMVKLVEHAWVSRVDIAIDVVGVALSEVLATHKQEGKRVLYIGQDGALESIYIHRKLPKPHTAKNNSKKMKHGQTRAGKTLVRIYDRVRERESVGKPPPFGPAPVTRIELIKQLKKRSLQSLLELENPLIELRAGFIESQFSSAQQASRGVSFRYAALRRTHTRAEALRLLRTSAEALGTSFDSVECADLVGPANWQDWKSGMELTGLASFVSSSTP